VSARSLPPSPNLVQLKRQAKELLRRQPLLGRLRDAQRALAQEYGFDSWDALRTHVESIGRASRAMIKPNDLESEEGRVTWATITAAAAGDVATLRQLLDRNPQLSRAGYWYTPSVHFAVREGHAQAVQLLLDAGADPEWNGYHDGSLVEMARERGHEGVARLLEDARQRMGRVAPGKDHPIHRAAQSGDLERVREILDADPSLLERGDRIGGSPLHRAVMGSARKVVELLLDRGADIHAFHSTSRGGGGGWWSTRIQAIDLAIWGWNNLAPSKRDFETAWLLVARGAECDLTVASALGDIGRVTAILVWLDDDEEVVRRAKDDPASVDGGVLTTVVTKGKRDLLQRLLDAGVRVPPVLTGCQGYLLEHTDMLRTLLAHGMSPDLMNWQHQTLLHLVCRGPDTTGAAVERAAVLLDAGADISARDDEYQSTPLAWAARTNAAQMVEFLLARGAPRTSPMMNRGPHRWHGPNGVNMGRSCRSCGGTELAVSGNRSLTVPLILVFAAARL
jgi:ankyrin repeat protein